MEHSPCFNLPLLVSPLYPLLLTWNPPSCDRNRPPQSQVACKLTPLVPHMAPVPSLPKFQPLLGFPGPNEHLIRATLRTQPSCSRTIIFSATYLNQGLIINTNLGQWQSQSLPFNVIQPICSAMQ